MKPAHQNEQWVSMFQADQKVVPRSVWGRFAQLRWITVWLTQLAFYGAAWVQYNGRQALLFDIDAQRFFIGPLVFYPQDFIYLTALLVVCALSLFLFTAVAGRLWCGYACPQTVYTEIFMWVERQVEGDRAARLRRSAGPWNVDRIWRTAAKHGVWLLIAFWTGFTFVGYFTPIQELFVELHTFTFTSWEMFWVGFYGLATYGNAGWMREQVCKYMCPYARFQSAMFDKDTLLVTYDERRGEPRGPRGKNMDFKLNGLGSCVDCNLCVQVCPTGIDIRKGLQYECIGCAACVDVCDGVMDKMGYDKGLIRYSTQNGMAHGWNFDQMLKRLFRPRVLVYTAVVWGLIAAVGVALNLRHDLRVDVVRDRNTQYRLVENGEVENVYRLNLMNASEFPLRVSGTLLKDEATVESLRIADDDASWVLMPTESRWVVVHVRANPDELKPGSNRFELKFDSQRVTDGVLLDKALDPSLETIVEPAVMLAPL
jgi:cytochrome c oxidase accessory protein FixG